MPRPSNRELIAQLRHLLTEGARDALPAATLAETKAWRAEIWKMIPELEDGLDPLAALVKEKERRNG